LLELARAGTKVKQLAATFRMSDATIYTWLKQERIDRGEAEGATTNQQLELGTARKRIRQLETELAVACKVNEVFLAEGIAPKRVYPVIASLTGQGVNVQEACVALVVSQSGYYAWKDPPTRPARCAGSGLRARSPTSTRSRAAPTVCLRVTAELKFARGITVGHCAVSDIMRQLGLKGLPRRRLPRGAKLHTVTSLDLVGRKFRRDRPNELWVADITEHPTREGKVYWCVVLDTFSRKVVGWSIDSTQTTSLVLYALGMATQRRPDRDGPVMHSDRGVQFMSWAVSHNLTQAGISPSMGAVGSAYDHALRGCPRSRRTLNGGPPARPSCAP
jgi:transposase InsO family protein/transposase-like protein